MNLASFWGRFPFHTTSAVDSILNRQHFTLEDLLEEDDIVQETKSQNKKLIEFLVQQTTLEKLFDYLVSEPEETDFRRNSKYPLLACEILCSEVWILYEAICNDEPLLERLFSFLSRDFPTPTVSCYASRFAGVLLQKRMNVLMEFLRKQQIAPLFMKHLGNPYITDLLLKIISCEENSALEERIILKSLSENALVPNLVERLNPTNDAAVIDNASQTLVDLISITSSAQATTNIPSVLLEEIESIEIVKQLFEFTFHSGTINLSVFNVIIDLLKGSVGRNTCPTFMQIVCNHLEEILEILNGATDPILMTPGPVSPFGYKRLKIVEFLVALVRNNYPIVVEIFITKEILGCCYNLFHLFPWNNFLHAHLEQFFQIVIETENNTLLDSLLVDTNITEKIIASFEMNQSECTKKRARLGFMGHLKNIIQLLTSTPNEHLRQSLSSNTRWNEFLQGPYAQQMMREKNTDQSNSEKNDPSSENEHQNPNSSELINVFQEYLTSQGFSNEYGEDANEEDEYYTHEQEAAQHAQETHDNTTANKGHQVLFEEEYSSEDSDDSVEEDGEGHGNSSRKEQ